MMRERLAICKRQIQDSGRARRRPRVWRESVCTFGILGATLAHYDYRIAARLAQDRPFGGYHGFSSFFGLAAAEHADQAQRQHSSIGFTLVLQGHPARQTLR